MFLYMHILQQCSGVRPLVYHAYCYALSLEYIVISHQTHTLQHTPNNTYVSLITCCHSLCIVHHSIWLNYTRLAVVGQHKVINIMCCVRLLTTNIACRVLLISCRNKSLRYRDTVCLHLCRTCRINAFVYLYNENNVQLLRVDYMQSGKYM
jgi:hypothetical protein